MSERKDGGGDTASAAAGPRLHDAGDW